VQYRPIRKNLNIADSRSRFVTYFAARLKIRRP